ncbi:response regulator transcription factor [Oscillospiraceae bacterium WX1]
MKQSTKRILVVDDEIKIVEVVKSYLEKSGYDVIEAFSGDDALKKFKSQPPVLVILDLMLPDISGEEVCRKMRENSDIPIIMLTAKVNEENILHGLNLGADDYVTKPFSPRQLVARVEAVLRRTSKETSDILSFNNNDLLINLQNYEVMKAGKSVSLTPNEFKILCAMSRHPNKVYRRDELIYLVSGEDYEGFDRIIDTHIKNIRQKIETDTKNPKYVLTVHGVGYRFGSC